MTLGVTIYTSAATSTPTPTPAPRETIMLSEYNPNRANKIPKASAEAFHTT